MIAQLDCHHHWENNGQLLACTSCGVIWPDDPTFPPAPFAVRNAGYAASADQPGWQKRVDRVVDELRRIA